MRNEMIFLESMIHLHHFAQIFPGNLITPIITNCVVVVLRERSDSPESIKTLYLWGVTKPVIIKTGYSIFSPNSTSSRLALSNGSQKAGYCLAPSLFVKSLNFSGIFDLFGKSCHNE